MARPISISREHILDAARAQFFECGYAVSTADIARRAGVSEGSIFKRFPTKEALFFAAMGMGDRDLPSTLHALRAHPDFQAGLVQVALELIGFLRELLPRVMMLKAHAAPDHLFARDQDAPPAMLLRAVTQHFEWARAAGKVTTDAPAVAARMLLGAVHNYVFFEVIGLQEGMEPAEAFAQSAVEHLWRGVAPLEEPA